VRFGLLGNLDVVDDDGRPVEIAGTQPRTLVAVLLVASGRVVPVDSILDAIWGEQLPVSAPGTLQSYVSRLRRALEPGRGRREDAKLLVWDPPGYRLDVDPVDVDFRRFESLADEGRLLLDKGDLEDARRVLVEADALWRGPALVEFADREFAQGTAARLEERRLAAIEDRIEADLRLGRHAAASGELVELVALHPLREDLQAKLALALYRSGRQADALRTLHEAGRTLREELGVEPSRPLRDLESQILAHDPALDHAGRDRRPQPQPSAPAPAVDLGEGEAADDGSGLVGRRRELTALLSALDDAGRGTRTVVVEGEPGIGKTRLVEELAARAADRGARVAWGRAHEGEAAPAFWPWLDVLRPLVEAVNAGGGVVPAELDRLLAPTGEAATGEAGAARFRLFESVMATLGVAAGDRPLVIVLDDIQWADPASLELVAHLATRLREERVLLVATVRELEIGRNDAVVDALAALARRPGSQRLHLHGLDAHDTGDLLARIAGRSVSAELATAIHVRADGNPFYATELARLLAVDELDGVATLAGVDIPAGVRDVVRRRLARLPASAGELLQVAAVIGRDIELDVLARAADRPVDAEPALLHRLLVAPDAPAIGWRFAHALVREVLVDDLSSLRQARLHLRVADAIVELSGDTDDVAEIVAEHLWAATPIGVGRRAAVALERAAGVALRRLAYEAAERLLERAVQLRRGVGSAPEDLEAELLSITRWSAVRRARHGYSVASAAMPLARARHLAEQVGRPDVFVNLLWAEWAAASTASDVRRSDPLVDELRELARGSDDPALQAIVHCAWGIQCWERGRMTEAADNLDRALAVAPPMGPGGEGGFELGAEHRLVAAAFDLFVHELVGDVDDVGARFDHLADQMPDPFALAVVQTFSAEAAVSVGDWGRAERVAQRGLAANPDIAFTFWGSGTQMFLGIALCHRGELEEARRLYVAGRSGYLAASVRTGLSLADANWALGLLGAGLVDEAAEIVAGARAELVNFGQHWTEPIVLLAEAEIAHHQGRVEDAGRLLAASIDVAGSQGSHGLARRAADRAARLGVTPS
jgi:DNA-binding SARP family transcriptional activator